MSIDIETLRQYQEWRAGNEGRMVDVSPDAFALHKAIDNLALDFEEKTAADIYDSATLVAKKWKALNAPTD